MYTAPPYYVATECISVADPELFPGSGFIVPDLDQAKNETERKKIIYNFSQVNSGLCALKNCSRK